MGQCSFFLGFQRAQLPESYFYSVSHGGRAQLVVNLSLGIYLLQDNIIFWFLWFMTKMMLNVGDVHVGLV